MRELAIVDVEELDANRITKGRQVYYLIIRHFQTNPQLAYTHSIM